MSGYYTTTDGRHLFRLLDGEVTTGYAGPYVVIDPSDREQVERLVRLFWDNGNDDCDDPPAMQAALREFANPSPPKPEEPQGLGAVVEDAEGALWFRMALENLTWSGEVWQGQYVEADRWSKWSDIAAVRILSEGVL